MATPSLSELPGVIPEIDEARSRRRAARGEAYERALIHLLDVADADDDTVIAAVRRLAEAWQRLVVA